MSAAHSNCSPTVKTELDLWQNSTPDYYTNVHFAKTLSGEKSKLLQSFLMKQIVELGTDSENLNMI